MRGALYLRQSLMAGQASTMKVLPMDRPWLPVVLGYLLTSQVGQTNRLACEDKR